MHFYLDSAVTFSLCKQRESDAPKAEAFIPRGAHQRQSKLDSRFRGNDVDAQE